MADRVVSVRLQAVTDQYNRSMKAAQQSTAALGTAGTTTGKQVGGAMSNVGAQATNVGGRFDRMKVAGAGAFTMLRTSALGMAGGITVATGAVYSAVQAASDLDETVAAAGIVFGESASEIEAFGESAARNLGMSTQQAIDAATTFAVLGKAAGLAGDDLVTFSTDMVALATDLASFKNTTPQEAIYAIGAALRGESEPIRRYGVLLDDATLKARGMEMGLYDGVGALSAQERALAAQAEILAQTSDAQGDFARTSDGLANKQRILAAEIENLKADIGGALVPALTDAVSALLAMKAAADKLGGINIGGWSILDSAKWASPLALGREGFSRLKGGIDDLRGSADITATFIDRSTEAVVSSSQALVQASIDAALLEDKHARVTMSADDMKAALERVTAQFERAKESTDRAREAQQRLVDTMMSAVGASFDYETANLRLVTGVRAYEESVKDGTKSSEELRLEELALAGQALQTAEAFAAEQTASGNAASAADLQKFALQQLQDQFPGLRDEIQVYIDKLNAIPSTINTTVNLRQGSTVAAGPVARGIGLAAEGAVLTRPTLLVGGEAGDEVVLPLTNPDRMRTLAADPRVFGPLMSALGASPAAATSERPAASVTVNNYTREPTASMIAAAIRMTELEMA